MTYISEEQRTKLAVIRGRSSTPANVRTTWYDHDTEFLLELTDQLLADVETLLDDERRLTDALSRLHAATADDGVHE